MESLLIFCALALIAEILGTVGGFGSSLFFVPLASFFFDFYSVLAITAVMHVFSNMSKIILFRKGVVWKVVLYLGIPAVVFVTLGALLSGYVRVETLEILLGFLLILLSMFFMISSDSDLQPTRINSVISGIVSGFVAGLLGTGGAIRGLTLHVFHLEKEAFIATSAIIDLGVDISRTVVYTSNGFLKTTELYLIPVLLGVSIVGTYIGKWLLNYISNSQFRIIVLVMILLVGIYTLMSHII